jgi:hypothetical protein
VHVAKSANCSSTTGIVPVIAAPAAPPTMKVSLIVVSRTRAGPNSSKRPRVTPKTPPILPMSWPIIQTLGSRRISSARAWLIAQA